MLWDQHRERYAVGDITVRRITYCKFRELTAEAMTEEEMGRIGYLTTKRQSGAELSPEETADLSEIAARWPIDGLRGACFIPPISAQACRDVLAQMPRKDSECLEEILDDCITPLIPQEDVTDPLALALVRTGGLGIDAADMTVGQGFAIAAMLAPGGQ